MQHSDILVLPGHARVHHRAEQVYQPQCDQLSVGGTGVSGLIRGFGNRPPPRWIQKPSVVRDRDGRPQEDPLAVHCSCVCRGSALFGDLLGVSRSRERDLLSVLSIYPRIFTHSLQTCQQ